MTSVLIAKTPRTIADLGCGLVVGLGGFFEKGRTGVSALLYIMSPWLWLWPESAASSFGMSAMRHSVVSSRPEMEAAF
jgi:hypothetical protein